MKIIKPANNRTNILKGVSTLDNMRIVLLFLVTVVFGNSVYAGHSILDRVDPSFNPDIVANLYEIKIVNQLQVLPDGKILAYGRFNSYNRVPTGNLVRLNADGSLDTSFNNQTITSTSNCDTGGLLRQPDGKIIVACRTMTVNGQGPKNMVRLNADGTLDTSFNYTFDNVVQDIAMDSLGRVLLNGLFPTPQGNRWIIRLNGDGSLDNSFNYTIGDVGSIEAQGNRLIISGTSRIYRVNENGSEDTSFTPLPTTGMGVNGLLVQPDNKILYRTDRVRRLNENGGNDDSFQSLISGIYKVASDGKIVHWRGGSSGGAIFSRFLPNGAPDPSFNQYTHIAFSDCFAIQSDGGVVLGDGSNPNAVIPLNNFVRLKPDGTPDPAFNPGGLGFQTILPGSIRAIDLQPDGKILLGGKIDVVNGVSCYRLARVNADATVDPSFQINTSGTGNYFSIIRDVYHIRKLADGKIFVTGWFDYVQGGVTKYNLVRLNSDGSIDTTFNLTETINDYSEIVGAGRNPLITFSDSKLMVGISRLNGFGPVGPLKLNQNGSRDTSFTSMLNTASPQMYIDDVELQPDGKILVSGTHNPFSGGPTLSFVARLNADGSLDPTFPYTEETGRLKAALVLLPNGKILVGKHTDGTGPGTVKRLNPNGSPDNSFNSLSIPGGIINALLALPNGKIFVGGKFTVLVNGQPTKNLLQLDADGNLQPTTYNIDSEVLCLAVDGEGRVLVGGAFTVIGANGGGENRSYVARLTDSTPFDFDGDGKSDIGIFRPSEGKWYLSQSTAGFSVSQWGLGTDRLVPADYDGDGKTDLAIYRDGQWWYFKSSNYTVALTEWGGAGDIPMPSDFDGDGKDDFIYYHPSTSEWFRKSSTEAISTIQFGIAEDIPLIADMDGDGKADPTIYRPSTGTWWYASSINGLFYAIQWGIATDIPAPGDYDGDGRTDPAYFRPSNGDWFVLNSGTNYTTYTVTNWGTTGDRPTPADYDGDGKTDLAIYRPSNGMWFELRSTSGFFSQQFGLVGDKAIPNAFLP